MGLIQQLRQLRDASADPERAVEAEIAAMSQRLGVPVAASLGPLGAGGGASATIGNIVGGLAGSGHSRRTEARLTGDIVDRRAGRFGYLVVDQERTLLLYRATFDRSRPPQFTGPVHRWALGEAVVELTARTGSVQVDVRASGIGELQFEVVTAVGPGRRLVDRFAEALGIVAG